VGYNTVTILWILSNSEYAQKYFEDYTLALIEKVTKSLDFCSWEKIVRMMLMLFDNVKENEICQEHLSDIDALSLITKLQNRHWVDEDINKLLEKLFEYFDDNQKVFSSIEKLKNQISRGQLRWGPCHTEQFWQENCTLFDRADNLAMMKKLVNDCLLSKNDKSRAVACFDLGEFSRFVPNGKAFLERMGIKEKMASIMQDP
jgi:V-type H+-transporting ATPase subunit H